MFTKRLPMSFAYISFRSIASALLGATRTLSCFLQIFAHAITFIAMSRAKAPTFFRKSAFESSHSNASIFPRELLASPTMPFLRGVQVDMLKTNGLKEMYFQEFETKCLCALNTWGTT